MFLTTRKGPFVKYITLICTYYCWLDVFCLFLSLNDIQHELKVYHLNNQPEGVLSGTVHQTEFLKLSLLKEDFITKPVLTLSWRGSYHVETSLLICNADQWTDWFLSVRDLRHERVFEVFGSRLKTVVITNHLENFKQLHSMDHLRTLKHLR